MELKDKKVESLKERMLQKRGSVEGQIKTEKPDHVDAESKAKQIMGEQINAVKPVKDKVLKPLPLKVKSIGDNNSLDHWMSILEEFPAFIDFDPLSANDLEDLVEAQPDKTSSFKEEQKAKIAHGLKSKKFSSKSVETIQTPAKLKDKKIPKTPSIKKNLKWEQRESVDDGKDDKKKPADVRRLSTVQQKKSFPVPIKLKDNGKGKSTFVSSIKKISSLADEIILKMDVSEQKKLEPNKVEQKIPGKKAALKPFKQPFQELGEKTGQKKNSKVIGAIKKNAPALKKSEGRSMLKKESSGSRSQDSVVDKLRLLVETIMTPRRKAVGASGKVGSTGPTADNRQVDTSSSREQRGMFTGDAFQGTQPIQSTVISEVNSEVREIAKESVSSRSNLMSAEEMAGKINEVLKEQAWIKGTNLP